jgi:serine beta-lactamase-like protein LACTB, mitochondrial
MPSKSLLQTAALIAVVLVGVVIAIFRGLELSIYQNANDVPSEVLSPPKPKWAHAVEQARHLARARVVEQNLPGLSVAVGVDGDFVWAEGFGWADLENQVRVTPTTSFRIGHASNAITSGAVGLLLEKDRLHLDDEIQTYVPEFPRKQWPVKLRQLLGHVAGVRHYQDEGDSRPSTHCDRASDGLRLFAKDPLLFEPETEYRYSTYGWILVSAAVEAAAQQPFFTFMRTSIFEPLGMLHTTFDSATERVDGRATFYYPRFSGDPSSGPAPAPAADYSCFAGAGSFLSTPSDLVRFGMALGGGTLLQPGTVRKLRTPQQLVSGKETAYGLGWMLETVSLAENPTRVAGHASRTIVGGSTSFMTFPELGLYVAVTSNISYGDTRSIALGIAQIFAELDLTPDDNDKRVKSGS